MRVIAGKLGGRNFNSPGGHKTHPMSDKIRGALFNMLGDIDGLTILDVFAGTGAVSFEAVSRGASSSVAVESDKKAQKIINENIENLGLEDSVTLFSGYASAWSNRNPFARFDIVVCDPPYNNVDFKVLDKMSVHVDDNGIFVLSWPGSFEIPKITKFQMIKQRSYGDAQLGFYVRVGSGRLS